MADHRSFQKIRLLEQQYADAKQNYEQWKIENASLKDTDSYKSYVENFSNWERGVQEQIREFRNSLTRQPVSPLPNQVPTADLDTQLNEALENVQPIEFMMAIFQMSSKDPTFLPSVFQAYHRITGVTRQSAPASRQIYSAPPPQHGYGYGSPSTSGMPQTVYQPQMSYPQQQQPMVVPNSIRLPPQQYTQSTPYGMIPSDWTLEGPVKKAMRPPSPIRSYEPAPMPFRDFSQK